MRFPTVCWLLASAISCAVVSGCGTAPGTQAAVDGTEGDLGLAIELGHSGIKTVQYVITGATGFNKVGTIDVSHSSKISTLIPALPAGTGYTIALSASATDPPSSCTGSAGFDVTPGEATPVDLTLQCVEINADFNSCPVIDGLSALPTQVSLGGAITLSADVRDPDSGPSPLTYDWSTTLGTLASSGAAATLTCDNAGVATVTLVTSDGGPGCATTDSVTVTCGDGASPVQSVPVPAPFLALLAAQLLALGLYRSARAGKRAD